MRGLPRRDTTNFRLNLAVLCAEHGEIQNVSKRANITRPYLSKIIHGHATPTIDVASRVAYALGIALSDLLLAPKEFSKIVAKTG